MAVEKEGVMPRKKSRKTGYGDGSFRLKPSGKIEYRFIYEDEFGQKKRKSVTGETRQDCLEKAEAFINGREKFDNSLNKASTIVEILKEKYKADYDKNFLSEAGYGRNLDSLKILEKSPLGKVPITAIEKRHIELYSTKITHYSNSTIEKIFIQLKLAFDIAVDEGIVSYNPMLSHSIRKPKSRKPDRKVTALTPEEQKRFIEVLETKSPPYGSNDYRLQLFIELYSGMRMGEINALTRDSIDFKNNVVHVTRTISKGVGNHWFLKDSTKTEAGIRDIPISKTLRPYLEKAVLNYKRNPLKLLFYDHKKKSVITTSQVNSYYKRVCDSIGIEAGGQHQLRHTFATRCIESGVPAVVLKTWLGHTDIHMTLDTYTDVFKRMDNEAIDKFDELLDTII